MCFNEVSDYSSTISQPKKNKQQTGAWKTTEALGGTHRSTIDK